MKVAHFSDFQNDPLLSHSSSRDVSCSTNKSIKSNTTLNEVGKGEAKAKCCEKSTFLKIYLEDCRSYPNIHDFSRSYISLLLIFSLGI